MRELTADNIFLQVFPKFLIENLGLIIISFIGFIIVYRDKSSLIIPILRTFCSWSTKIITVIPTGILKSCNGYFFQ